MEEEASDASDDANDGQKKMLESEENKHKNLMEKKASDASSDTNDGHHQPALPSKLVGLFSKPAGVNLKKDGKKVKVLASFVSSY